jgi:uncharacterized membrane protein
MSVLDEIAKLKALLDDGAITQDEYDAEKAKLLAGGDTPGPQPGGRQTQWNGQGQEQGQPHYGHPYGAGHVPGTPYRNYEEDVAANKVFGILSYVWILCFVSLFAAPKESHYARFHANQGLVLFIFEVAGSIVFNILGVSSGVAVFSTWGIGWGPLAAIRILSTLYFLAMFALAVIGLIGAARGYEKPLPVIGGITILK